MAPCSFAGGYSNFPEDEGENFLRNVDIVASFKKGLEEGRLAWQVPSAVCSVLPCYITFLPCMRNTSSTSIHV
jgi:hypothetical protein